MIGEILKEARIKKGLSVIDVSKLIEVDRTTYFRYENNQIKNIPTQNLLKLANILDIDLNKIKINLEMWKIIRTFVVRKIIQIKPT